MLAAMCAELDHEFRPDASHLRSVAAARSAEYRDAAPFPHIVIDEHAVKSRQARRPDR